DVVFLQGLARRPQEDTHSVYEGLIGNFPNIDFEVPLPGTDSHGANDFLKRLGALKNAADWDALKADYGLRRNARDFWTTVDAINFWNVNNDPVGAGIKDLIEYDLPELES
ncbi:MAG: fatty acid cis/trans isomerase, partial [Bdellovibrionales bacterium]|nr:fatty acid cis/trans isomerase [Bdellovibrionales bacterium]